MQRYSELKELANAGPSSSGGGPGSQPWGHPVASDLCSCCPGLLRDGEALRRNRGKGQVLGLISSLLYPAPICHLLFLFCSDCLDARGPALLRFSKLGSEERSSGLGRGLMAWILFLAVGYSAEGTSRAHAALVLLRKVALKATLTSCSQCYSGAFQVLTTLNLLALQESKVISPTVRRGGTEG